MARDSGDDANVSATTVKLPLKNTEVGVTHTTSGVSNIEDSKDKQIRENLERFEHLFGTDEDAFEQPTTSRRELWSYYLYYNGMSGLVAQSLGAYSTAVRSMGRVWYR
jgi:hypothetical protein